MTVDTNKKIDANTAIRRQHGRVVWVSASYPGDPGSIPGTPQDEPQAKQERRQLASGLNLIP